MSELEQVVRPFQTNEVSPARQYYNAGQIGVSNVSIRAGRSGQGKVFNSSASVNETFYMTKYVIERKDPFSASQDFGSFNGQFGQGVIGEPLGS